MGALNFTVLLKLLRIINTPSEGFFLGGQVFFGGGVVLVLCAFFFFECRYLHCFTCSNIKQISSLAINHFRRNRKFFILLVCKLTSKLSLSFTRTIKKKIV